MAFTFEVKGRTPLNPPVKRYKEAGNLFWEWIEWANTAGSTGGEITTSGDTVLLAIPTDLHASPAVIVVALNSAASGQVTITTTADHPGRLLCLIHKRKG